MQNEKSESTERTILLKGLTVAAHGYKGKNPYLKVLKNPYLKVLKKSLKAETQKVAIQQH